MSEHYDDTVIRTQAMLELTDAHVSPIADGAWDAAVADVRQEAEVEAATQEEEYDTLLDVAIAFG